MESAPQFRELADLLPKEGIQSATRLGLCISPGLGADAWSRLVAGVVRIAGRSSGSRVTLTAWLGDLLAYGDGSYKGQIKEYAKAAGLEPGTLRMAKLVCSRIPVSSRLDTLSWAHHWEIGAAFKDPIEIRRWLEIASKGGYSKAELRKLIREHLAASAPSAQAENTATAFFGLMRELQAMDRYLGRHPKVWTQWSTATCRRALGEIKAVAAFVESLKERASRAPCETADR
jgi:hypothetical protein